MHFIIFSGQDNWDNDYATLVEREGVCVEKLNFEIFLGKVEISKAEHWAILCKYNTREKSKLV